LCRVLDCHGIQSTLWELTFAECILHDTCPARHTLLVCLSPPLHKRGHVLHYLSSLCIHTPQDGGPSRNCAYAADPKRKSWAVGPLNLSLSCRPGAPCRHLILDRYSRNVIGTSLNIGYHKRASLLRPMC
jgi:hypothetical protein